MAALVDQVGGGHDQDQYLQELGLPVLEGPFTEVDGVARIAEQRRLLTLGGLVGDVLPPTEDHVQQEAVTNRAPMTMLRL